MHKTPKKQCSQEMPKTLQSDLLSALQLDLSDRVWFKSLKDSSDLDLLCLDWCS